MHQTLEFTEVKEYVTTKRLIELLWKLQIVRCGIVSECRNYVDAKMVRGVITLNWVGSSNGEDAWL